MATLIQVAERAVDKAVYCIQALGFSEAFALGLLRDICNARLKNK